MTTTDNTIHENAAASGAFDPRDTEEQIKERLKNLGNVDSDDKAILWDEFSRRMYSLKNRSIKIGLKVLEMLIDIIERFPYTVSFALIACIINLIISAIPLIGWMLGPLTGALLMTGAIGVGVVLDLKLNVINILKNDLEAMRRANQSRN